MCLINGLIQLFKAWITLFDKKWMHIGFIRSLKGRTDERDCRTAISTLYHVLQTSCKVMDPFTPYFTEILYQNIRKIWNSAEESVHYCDFPKVEGKREECIERSVKRTMKVIDHTRNIRECHNKPLKTPLREIVVVYPDVYFLDDISDKLKEFILEELNVQSLVTCKDTLKYAFLRAEPDFSVLGKKLGMSMGFVVKEVKDMSTEDILGFDKAGEVTFGAHTLKLNEIKVVRRFRNPDDVVE